MLRTARARLDSKGNEASELKLEEMLLGAGLGRLHACVECGLCSGICPSGTRTSLRTRKLVRSAREGDARVLESPDLWACATCYTCQENCPHLVPVTDAIIFLRNLACQGGHMRLEHVDVAENLVETGFAVPPSPPFEALREKLNLPPRETSEPALGEIRFLLHSTGFTQLVGENAGPCITQKSNRVQEAKC